MACSKCTPEQKCNRCFPIYFERKLRKIIKEQGGISREASINCPDNLLPFLKQAFSFPLKKGKDKVIIDWTIEDECDLFLHKIMKKQTNNTTAIKLFLPFPKESVKRYADLKKISYTPKEHDYHIKSLEKLSRRYPETKFSLLKTIQKLNGKA